MIPTGSIDSFLMGQIFGGGGSKGRPSITKSFATQAGYTPQRNDLIEINPSTGAANKTVTQFETGQVEASKIADGNNLTRSRVLMFSDNKGVVTYDDSYPTVAFFEIKGATVYVSPPVVVSNDSTSLNGGHTALVMINSTQFVLLMCTSLSSSSRYFKAFLFNYTGSGISYVSTTTLAAISDQLISNINVALISTDKLFITYCISSSGSTNTQARVITRNGSTFDVSTPTTFLQGQSYTFSHNLHKLNNTTFVYVGQSGTATWYGRLVVDPATNLVTHTNGTLRNFTNSYYLTSALLNNNKVLVVGGNSPVYAFVLDIATLTAGSNYNLITTNVGGVNAICSYDHSSPSRAALIVGSGTNRRGLIISVIDLVPSVVGTMTSMTTSYISNNLTTEVPFLGAAAPGKLIYSMRTGSANPYTLSFEFYSVKGDTVSGGMTQVRNPLAIVTSIGSGQVQAALNNGIVGSFSGLTTLTKYYCDENGNLTTTPVRQPIGVAISPTEIFFYGLTSMVRLPIAYNGQVTRTHTVAGVTVGRVVKLNANNTIINYNGSGLAYGVYQGNGVVVLSGIVRGLSGLNMNKRYFFDNNGVIGEVDLGEERIVGTPISSTELLMPGFLLSNNRGIF